MRHRVLLVMAVVGQCACGSSGTAPTAPVRRWSWSSSDPAVLIVSPSGVMRSDAAGRFTVALDQARMLGRSR